MSVLLKLCSDLWGMLGLVVVLTGAANAFASSLHPVSLVTLATGVALLAVHAVRAGRAKRIVANGQAVSATITRANVSRYTSISTTTSQYGPDDPSLLHPTVIWFTYQYGGQTYTGRSGLLWAAPEYAQGQQITIHILEDHPEQYAV